MRSVTVYCSSSGALEPHFAHAARDLGAALAARGIALVFGGGAIGLMGECARAAKAGGGHVTGIITQKLKDHEQAWDGCDEMLVVGTMQERRSSSWPCRSMTRSRCRCCAWCRGRARWSATSSTSRTDC